MQTFKHEDLDDEILGDLLEEINELYEESEQTLISLEETPSNNELQRALFRSIHTIKGDLGMVNFTPLIPLVQHVEDLLDFLRNGQIKYTSTMSDLVLLSMDRVKIFVEGCINTGSAQYDDELFNHLVNHIDKIKPDNTEQHEKLLRECVLLLDPSLDLEIADSEQSTDLNGVDGDVESLRDIGISADVSEDKQIDIGFFRELMKPIERRSMYWEGRGDRIAKLAVLVNKLGGDQIDNEQLLVACYVHDFGMAFMPQEILHRRDDLKIPEFNLMRSHVYKSSRLLEHLDQWNEARKIVLQHHERCDGTGYPMGLTSPDICEGAKLLGIIDTFETLSHQGARDNQVKRPSKRAVIEMNNMSKGLFCPRWMKLFNVAMGRLLTRPE